MKKSKKRYWCLWAIASALLLLANMYPWVFPKFILESAWFNSLSHFLGGAISGWGYFLTFQSTPPGSIWGTRLIKATFFLGSIIGLGTLYQFYKFYELHGVYDHGLLYENLMQGLHFYAAAGFLVAVSRLSFVYDPRIAERSFFFCYVLSGVMITGVSWEIMEYWFSFDKLGQWTPLTVYEDTIKDLFMDFLGGIAYLVALLIKNPRFELAR